MFWYKRDEITSTLLIGLDINSTIAHWEITELKHEDEWDAHRAIEFCEDHQPTNPTIAKDIYIGISRIPEI